MSTWEERMAARAKERRRARGELDWRPADTEERLAQARAEYIATHPGCESPVPPEEPSLDYCRECLAWRPYGSMEGVYYWVVGCNFKCGHAHHKDEIWLA